MIEALARLMPQYAFWLSTGLTDPKYGHVAPENEGFPDRGEEQPASTRYFKESVSARDAAYAALDAWIQEKFGIDDPIEAELSKADRLLRAMPKLTNEENGALNQAMARVRTSEEIRRAEIDMHDDMPEMDYDETETVLRSIKRAMSKLAERASAHTMGEEFESVQRKIAHIDEMIVRHRRASATLGQKNDDRDTAK
ncbi:hypothetical protein P0D87_23665 [Paraburkholderia sp. RL17-368-BIF-A]|uniref:hypothetical protein n=1 Tax=Paraburkholderia sp. RL17-368-BIF-A TaxID=3031628 RepID=UPI0038C54CE4